MAQANSIHIGVSAMSNREKGNEEEEEEQAQAAAAAAAAARMNNVSYGSKRVFILLKNIQYIVIYSLTLEYNTVGPLKK